MKIIQKWVTREISDREWKGHYSQLSSYCYLGAVGVGKGKRSKIGFVIGLLEGDTIPANCMPCTDEDLRQIDDYRVANNIRPFPLEMHKTG